MFFQLTKVMKKSINNVKTFAFMGTVAIFLMISNTSLANAFHHDMYTIDFTITVDTGERKGDGEVCIWNEDKVELCQSFEKTSKHDDEIDVKFDVNNIHFYNDDLNADPSYKVKVDFEDSKGKEYKGETTATIDDKSMHKEKTTVKIHHD